MRYKAIVEYVGTNFIGWQRQAEGMSVQQTIEDAITKICRHLFSESYPEVEVVVAGRTDSGVHAFGQVIHFDIAEQIDIFSFVESINFFMRPNPVKIIELQPVTNDFHARYNAIRRHYFYRIVTRPVAVEIERERVWFMRQKLDAKIMQQAADCLYGLHDFSSFRASNCQASHAMRTIDNINIATQQYQGLGEEIKITISAQSFLHHMVRNIVGSLVLVGSGEWSVEDFEKILKAKDRSLAGPTAPACGLYFHYVDY